MVSGAFSYRSVGHLLAVEGNIKAQDYIKIIENGVLPSAERLCGLERYILQQDNAPVHTARVTTAFLKDNGVTVLDWPGQSPDLNPIENVWSKLGHIVQRQHYANKHELFGALLTTWNSLEGDYLHSLVDSMPNRMLAVIKAKGGATRY